MQVPNITHTLGSLKTLSNPGSYDAHGKTFALSVFGWRWNVRLSNSALPGWILIFPVKF